MPIVIRHVFNNPVTDDLEFPGTRPSHWNDGLRAVAGAHGALFYRDVADPVYGVNVLDASPGLLYWPDIGSTPEIVTVGSGLSVAGGVLSVGAPSAHATSHLLAGSDPIDVRALGGFPGGATTFLRADGTFATPGAALPTDALGKVLVSQGVGVASIYSDQPQLIGATAKWAVRPSAASQRWYSYGINDGSGALEVAMIHDVNGTAKYMITPTLGPPPRVTVSGGSSDTELVLQAGGAAIVLCPAAGGGARPVQFGRRISDNSNAVGAHVECWPTTSQTQPALAVMVPGGASARWGVMGTGEMFLVQLAADPAAVVGRVALFAKDNGSGKTQLCARFPTGAVLVVGTEP
jgi:hypothetical protein